MRDPKDGVRKLFDELSPTYDTAGIDFFGQIARELVLRARLREGSNVLDAGCGAGAALLAAAEAVGPTGSVLGIDLAEGMVERASREVLERGLENVVVQVGDAEAPPAPPGSVDAIVSSLVLFFLPNIELALDVYAQTLVPGGTLAFSTFAGDDDWSPLDELLASFAPPAPQEDAWFDSTSGIRAMLDGHGFHGVSIEDVTHQVEFPSLSAFHAWNWSTGARATWTAIPAEERAAARTAVDRYLESLRERRGALRLETAVRYTRAVAA